MADDPSPRTPPPAMPETVPEGSSEAVATRPVLRARELLGRRDRVAIEHDGALYELRLTRNNKLILTK